MRARHAQPLYALQAGQGGRPAAIFFPLGYPFLYGPDFTQRNMHVIYVANLSIKILVSTCTRSFTLISSLSNVTYLIVERHLPLKTRYRPTLLNIPEYDHLFVMVKV
jgi:hypothetical protein